MGIQNITVIVQGRRYEEMALGFDVGQSTNVCRGSFFTWPILEFIFFTC